MMKLKGPTRGESAPKNQIDHTRARSSVADRSAALRNLRLK
jgi:hypothetical protein